ncbi:DUF3574 domain-containing protein [Alkalinema pantanalense]|uniref:DUF3574 domain-containing protein n=1 Tax=Alkalinema pantanalense TaxID=1620705 RepID=UPI003D6E1543
MTLGCTIGVASGLIFVSDRGLAESTPPTPSIVCSAGQMTKTELFFGLSKPKGDRVSLIDWHQFLQTIVTPRFREGLTVVDGFGQYLDQSGKLIIEPSKIVLLLHDNSIEKQQAIVEITQTYKRNFQQESVLRLTSCVYLSFD